MMRRRMGGVEPHRIRRRTSLGFSVFIGILLFILGISLVIYRQGAFKVISTVAGIILLISSIYSFVYSGSVRGRNFRSALIGKGSMSILISFLMVVAPWTFGSELWNFFMYVIAFSLFIFSILTFVVLVTYRPIGFMIDFFFEGVLLFAAGMLFLLKPANIGRSILLFGGIALMFIAVCLVLTAYTRRYDLEEV